MSTALRIYHRLPYRLKCVVASARGRSLRRWRFGPGTPAAVAAALERDARTAEGWRRWQTEALSSFLRRAAARVPYYQALWASGRCGSAEELSAWPILTKATLRERALDFVADDRPLRDLFAIRTSGTTGTPLRLWWSRETARAWYALYEARIRHWNGVSRHDAWGLVGGQLVTPVARKRPPYWVWNRPMRQLYLSAYHIDLAATPAYIEAMRAHGIRHLLGYPSALAALARFGAGRGLRPPSLRVVVTNAEPLSPRDRTAIGSFFDCEVRDTYGMAEAAAGASECAHGAMHLWPEAGVVEVLDAADRPVPAGTTGRLVVTGLLHDAMPLVRYDVGDLGALHPGDTPCPCGRTLPRLLSIKGRTDDVLRTRSGRHVGRLDPVFKDDLPLEEAQIIQRSLDHLIVRVVAPAGLGTAGEQTLRRRLVQRLGDIEIRIEHVDAIPRGPGGKFRAVISELPPGTTSD